MGKQGYEISVGKSPQGYSVRRISVVPRPLSLKMFRGVFFSCSQRLVSMLYRYGYGLLFGIPPILPQILVEFLKLTKVSGLLKREKCIQ